MSLTSILLTVAIYEVVRIYRQNFNGFLVLGSGRPDLVGALLAGKGG